jgi:hypothetical protein
MLEAHPDIYGVEAVTMVDFVTDYSNYFYLNPSLR